MKRRNPNFLYLPFAAFLLVLFPSCGSFKKGVEAYNDHQIEKAEKIFRKKENHRIYDLGAQYYLGMLGIDKEPTVQAWLGIHDTFCSLAFELEVLPDGRKRRLLTKRGVTRGKVVNSKDNLELRILDALCRYGTIADLDTLGADPACWEHKGGLDSVRTIIVNKTIDPDVVVFADKDCLREKGPTGTEGEAWGGKGWPCGLASALGSLQSISYLDATAIVERYSQEVIQANYGRFWEIQEHIWNIFLKDHSFPEMDRFREEHPWDMHARDCWFDGARDTLSLGLLRPLLAFHRNNPHTIFDFDICSQILCLAGLAEDAGQLNAAEKKQVEDVEMMFRLFGQLTLCQEHYDTTELIPKVAYLAEKYPYHQVVFMLAKATANYFYTQAEMGYAWMAMRTLRPLFPDSAACEVELDFQTGKQPWFETYAGLLERAGDRLRLPDPAVEWNTPEYDEYGLVSWGETEEVYFVRKNRETGQAYVMISQLSDTGWTVPLAVPELSVSNDVLPLSVFADGHLMILKAEGKLMEAYRPATKRRWSRPTPMPVAQGFSGKAALSNDGTFLLVENYSSPAGPLKKPKTDLYMVKLGDDGRYSKPEPIGARINMEEENEGRPLLALGGRLLLITSDREGSMGMADMFSVPLNSPNDWESAARPVNLGLQVNTVFDEAGLSFFSEYTGRAYFDSWNTCRGDRDIFSIEVGEDAFPANALRLAGVVLDENRMPIGGGFVEFLPDYSLSAHSQPVSAKGAYSFTIPENTAVVRLFPEVPGYYSERDTLHYLANMPKGQIIRDTFILTSFEYIRKNFKLEQSTFITGTAIFNNPDQTYPELTRFAKIATRMGAELDLIGHTDGVGTEKNNIQLSVDRAQSVKNFLVDKCGFDPDKIRVSGCGSSKPICTNDTEEGRRCNRRVEVVFRMPELKE